MSIEIPGNSLPALVALTIGNLKNARQFYQVYSPSIRQSLISESKKEQAIRYRCAQNAAIPHEE
jgi:hypothetical protein